MASHYTRPAVGTINGINTTFDTPAPYKTGTVEVVRNGQYLKPSAWIELGGTGVQLADPPVTGDVVLIQFVPL